MIIEIDTNAKAKFIYTDELADLMKEGNCKIGRVSNVEPTKEGWKCFMTDGTILGPFHLREDALKAEVKYLEEKLFPKEG